MKKIFILTTTILLIFVMSLNIYAEEAKTTDVGDVITSMNGVQNKDSTIKTGSGIGAVINDVIGLLQLAGTGIAVVTVTVLGLRYMLSSVEQKAEIKNKAMPVVIGCIILFGAVNIVAIVVNFTNTALG